MLRPRAGPECLGVRTLRDAEGSGGAARRDEGRRPAKKPRKAAAGQREMLMPIEGKKPKEVPAKKRAARPQRKSA